jgi:vacuolar-type H+-ATPase catalytic subunit A/Vma1
MAIRKLDELNNMSKSPEDYFGEMDLTQSQIDERLRYTDEMYEAILDSMYEIDTYKQFGQVDYSAIQQRLDDRMASIIAAYVVLDDYLLNYTRDFSQNFVDATQRHPDNDWYLSEDRALFDAENSANDAINYKDYKKAIEDGFTHKKWITERDNKVRDTHRALQGKEIPIRDYFVVGGVLMRFPKDYELAFDAPQETVSCRCTIKYLKR